MYEVFIKEGSQKPKSVVLTEHMEDYYNEMKQRPMCPDICYKFDHKMCLKRGGVNWYIVEIRDERIPLGIRINSKDWKERIKKTWPRHFRIVVDRPDVTSEDLLRFMQDFNPNSKMWAVVTCYDRPEIWVKRKDAMKFYKEGMLMCEGSERDRYTNIYLGLTSGQRIVNDGE